jgi:hypothetical protein
VRGGSSAMTGEERTGIVNTRAGLYPDLKSQFTGWRPVIERGSADGFR